MRKTHFYLKNHPFFMPKLSGDTYLIRELGKCPPIASLIWAGALFLTLTAHSVQAADYSLPEAADSATAATAADRWADSESNSPSSNWSRRSWQTEFTSEEGWYKVGPGDILEIAVLQPEKIRSTVTVSMDGAVSFPFIGNVMVKGKTLAEIQQTIQQRLADGYFQYPVVSVAMQESNSKEFFVYGEVNAPGAYDLTQNMTLLRAISVAGGFTKFGSTTVRVLRPREIGTGYETIEVNVNEVMRGNSAADKTIKSGDVIVVAEGRF